MFLSVFVDISMILIFLFLSELEKQGVNRRRNERLGKIFLEHIQGRVIALKHIVNTNNGTHLSPGKIKWQILHSNNIDSKLSVARANDLLQS